MGILHFKVSLKKAMASALTGLKSSKRFKLLITAIKKAHCRTY